MYPEDVGRITFEAHNTLGIAESVTEIITEGILLLLSEGKKQKYYFFRYFLSVQKGKTEKIMKIMSSKAKQYATKCSHLSSSILFPKLLTIKFLQLLHYTLLTKFEQFIFHRHLFKLIFKNL